MKVWLVLLVLLESLRNYKLQAPWQIYYILEDLKSCLRKQKLSLISKCKKMMRWQAARSRRSWRNTGYLDNSRPGQLVPDSSSPIFRQLAPIWKHLCYVGQIYFYAHKVIISWKKKACFLKYITRPRLTFVAFDCNDHVNTWTWPFRNPATTFKVTEVKQI